LTIRGQVVPVPDGASAAGGISDPGGPFWIVERGKSLISFTLDGDVYLLDVAPEDATDFAPILHALGK
jgi:hypothetical protein